MIKDATINGRPLSAWGAGLMSGTIEALLTPASMKEYIKNESRLENGSRIITTSAKVASRELSLPFLIEGNGKADFIEKYSSFVNELYKGNIALYIPGLKKTFTLTYLSCGKYGSYGDCRAKLMVKFIEAVPVENKD